MGDLYSVDEIASTPSENISGEISSEATITETDPSSDAASCGDDGDYFVSDPLVDPLVDPDLDVCVDTRTPDGMALALEQVQSSDFQQQTAGLESLESNPELDACFVPTDKGNEPYILAQTISKDPVRNAVGWKTAERAGILEKAIRLVEKIIENLKQMIEKGEIEAQALIKDFVKRATHPQAQERVKKIAENSSKSTPISSSSQKGNRKSAAAIGASGQSKLSQLSELDQLKNLITNLTLLLGKGRKFRSIQAKRGRKIAFPVPLIDRRLLRFPIIKQIRSMAVALLSHLDHCQTGIGQVRLKKRLSLSQRSLLSGNRMVPKMSPARRFTQERLCQRAMVAAARSPFSSRPRQKQRPRPFRLTGRRTFYRMNLLESSRLMPKDKKDKSVFRNGVSQRR
jgi:hypothetical protein